MNDHVPLARAGVELHEHDLLPGGECEARARFERAVANATAKVASTSDADLLAVLPEGPIMGGVPRIAI